MTRDELVDKVGLYEGETLNEPGDCLRCYPMSEKEYYVGSATGGGPALFHFPCLETFSLPHIRARVCIHCGKKLNPAAPDIEVRDGESIQLPGPPLTVTFTGVEGVPTMPQDVAMRLEPQEAPPEALQQVSTPDAWTDSDRRPDPSRLGVKLADAPVEFKPVDMSGWDKGLIELVERQASK